jgi:hypothetical protein
MPVTLPFRVVFATSAVIFSCSAGLLTLLKRVLRSECPAPAGSSLRPVAIPCVVVTALCLVASTAYLVKSRAWTQAAAICSNWQPAYFVIVTVQALILRAIVSAGSRQTGSCLEYERVVHAISLMWNCAMLMTALSTMCCDTAADLSPRQRRCAYGLLAMALLLDAIGSVVWGNPLASDASLSVTRNFTIFLDSQLTSCIASQAVLALHFVYVAFRSRGGRGWAYASLRFELDECGKSLSMSMVPTMTSSRKDSGATLSAATPVLTLDASAQLQHAGAARWNAFSRLRQRWLQFQQRQVSLCRVFAVPCVEMRDAGGGGGEVVIALARPALDLRWLRPLQRLADAHPRHYIGFAVFVLAVPAFACDFLLRGQTRGISTLVFLFCICIMMFGFLSSKRYGLDRVAVKHVALSFRFAVFVTLLATIVALNIREVYTIDKPPTYVVGIAFSALFFCLCILLDCSPHVPPSVQIYISVRARTNCEMQCCVRVCLNISAGWMVYNLWMLYDFLFTRCILWWRSRLLPRSRSVQDLRRHSEALLFHQHHVADDASARIAHAGARHEQLRQRVGEALASARMRHHTS